MPLVRELLKRMTQEEIDKINAINALGVAKEQEAMRAQTGAQAASYDPAKNAKLQSGYPINPNEVRDIDYHLKQSGLLVEDKAAAPPTGGGGGWFAKLAESFLGSKPQATEVPRKTSWDADAANAFQRGVLGGGKPVTNVEKSYEELLKRG